MLTMSRSKKGVWVLFTRTAMRDGWGSSSAGVFCTYNQSPSSNALRDFYRQELCKPLPCISLTLFRGRDAVLEVVDDDIGGCHERLLEHALRRGWDYAKQALCVRARARLETDEPYR